MTGEGTHLVVAGLGEIVHSARPGTSQRTGRASAARRAESPTPACRLKDIDGGIDLRRTGGGGDLAELVDAYYARPRRSGAFYFAVGRGGALAGSALAVATASSTAASPNMSVVGAVTDWSQAQETQARWPPRRRTRKRRATGARRSATCARPATTAWMAARHMAVYGTTSRQLGAISVAERAWACKNPEAKMYGRPMTIEDHQNSPWRRGALSPARCQPRLATAASRSCSPPRIGPRTAPSSRSTCWARASARSSAELWWEKKNFTHMAVAPREGAGVRRRPALALEDIDCAQFYDCFTAEVLLPARGLRLLREGRGRPVRRVRRHRPRRHDSGRSPAAACSPAITWAI